MNSIDKIIGQKITELRVARKLSMKKVAEMLEVSHQQLHKYEKGINRISASKLFLLSKKLNINPNYFYNIEYDNLSENCSEIEELISSFLKLKSVEKRRAILNLLNELKS
jgi:transcriptional regulator with XRE-family HTH domain